MSTVYIYDLANLDATLAEEIATLKSRQAKLVKYATTEDTGRELRGGYVIDAAYDVELQAEIVRLISELTEDVAAAETEDGKIEALAVFINHLRYDADGRDLTRFRLDASGLGSIAEAEARREMSVVAKRVHKIGERAIDATQLRLAEQRVTDRNAAEYAEQKRAEQAEIDRKHATHVELYGDLTDADGRKLTTQRVQGALKRAKLYDVGTMDTASETYRIPGANGDVYRNSITAVRVRVYAEWDAETQTRRENTEQLDAIRAALREAGLFVTENPTNDVTRILVTGYVAS